MSQVSWKTPMKGRLGRPGVGQPYNVESWTYTVRAKFSNEVVYAQTSPGWLTHQQGVNQLLSLGATYGANYVVCGTYKPVYQYYGVGTTYCTYDGGASYQVGAAVPPPPAPVPVAPIPFYTRQSIFPIVETPFIVPFGSTTRVTWTTRAGGGTFAPIFGPRGVQWLGGRLGEVPAACWGKPGFKDCAAATFKAAQDKCYSVQPNGIQVSDEFGSFSQCTDFYDNVNPECVNKYNCKSAGTPSSPNPWGVYSADTKALQDELNVRLVVVPQSNAPYGYYPINADGKLGPATCGAAQTVWPQMEPNECAGHAVTLPKKKTATGDNNNPPPPPPPECTPTKPCPPGKTCVEGLCVDATPVPSTSSSSSSGLGGVGALALAGLALGAFAFFGKAPKLPKSAAGRLQQNPKRRRHKKRGRYAA
jgi:hypothetical protein